MHRGRASSRGHGLSHQRDKWERSWTGPPEDHHWFRARVEPIIAETVASADFPPGVAVDVGCGAGGVTHFLGEGGRFPLAVGLDLAFHAVERARARADGHDSAFGVADALDLPLSNGSASLMVDRGCLHCLTLSAASRYLDEVTRVLAPGGRFVLIARMSSALPPVTWALRHPRGAARVFAPFLRRRRKGTLARALSSPESVVALLPSTLEVERIECTRLRSDAGWHLRHTRLVAHRTGS